MVMHYHDASMCMSCQDGPYYFFTLQLEAASAHYAHSPLCSKLCFQSQKPLLMGMATVVLPNRPFDAEEGAGGSTGVEPS